MREIVTRVALGACSLGLLALFGSVPARANISFDVTLQSSITSDPNAAAVVGDINSVISYYESIITNPITVAVSFGEMTSGLGSSSTFYSPGVSYNTYCNDLKSTIGGTSVGNTIFGSGGSIGTTCGSTDPVTGSSDIDLKTANARAVGILLNPPSGQPDGTIGLNTGITDADGCTSTSGSCYYLVPVIEHELDEVLGLGSSLGNGGTAALNGQIFPEDLFRYSAAGVRGFQSGQNCSGTITNAYFSVDNGTSNLAGFNNGCNGGDWADWDSASNRVQNAFATPIGFAPEASLGVEITALEAIGYTFESTVPEPATLGVVGLTLVGLGLWRRKPSR